MGIVSQRFLSLGAQDIGRLPRFVEEPLAFSFSFLRRLVHERVALLVELLVLGLDLVALLLGFCFFCVGVCQLLGDPFLASVDSVKNGPVKEMLQQPHQNEEVDDLRQNGKPVDQHEDTSKNSYFIPTAALRKKFLANISIICGEAN